MPPLVSGTLFGAGLTLSGMTDPARVRGFLDVFGNWDPTLAFVMGGAVLVMAVAWRIRARTAKPLFGEKFSLPGRGDFDPQLLVGSALFGIGWGIAGLWKGGRGWSLRFAMVRSPRRIQKSDLRLSGNSLVVKPIKCESALTWSSSNRPISV